MSTGIRRNKNPPLLRSFRHFAPPCLLVVLIVIFGMAQRRSATTLNRTNQQVSHGATFTRSDIANNRAYIRYLIAGRGKRYWLGSIADRFKVDGGWRKIAEMSLKHDGKETKDKDIFEWQFRLETGKVLLIPL